MLGNFSSFVSCRFFSKLTHLCQIYFPILIDWTSPFPILGLLDGIFHFYSNFKRHFCKQTVENLIRRPVLRRLIWFCTVCICPTKRTLGLYGLTFSKKSFKEHYQCQMVWIQIRTWWREVLIWVQTVCKGYQQTTRVTARKERVNNLHFTHFESSCFFLNYDVTILQQIIDHD